MNPKERSRLENRYFISRTVVIGFTIGKLSNGLLILYMIISLIETEGNSLREIKIGL